jgi:hypothetical protein
VRVVGRGLHTPRALVRLFDLEKLVNLVLFVAAVDLDLCAGNVQDAFVIAVEQQAQERLERLTALKRVKPVDMTKLSQQVNMRRGTMNF